MEVLTDLAITLRDYPEDEDLQQQDLRQREQSRIETYEYLEPHA